MSANTCLIVLTFSAMLVVFSAVLMVSSINEDAKGAAWFWALSFTASSAAVAYCFWRLAWGA